MVLNFGGWKTGGGNGLAGDDRAEQRDGTKQTHEVARGSGTDPHRHSIRLGEVAGDVTGLLRAAPDDVLRVWRVDKKVGNVRNDGPELIKPLPGRAPTLL